MDNSIRREHAEQAGGGSARRCFSMLFLPVGSKEVPAGLMQSLFLSLDFSL
jgi:ABC-type proline/glycine betaine transport system permease subunit